MSRNARFLVNKEVIDRATESEAKEIAHHLLKANHNLEVDLKRAQLAQKQMMFTVTAIDKHLAILNKKVKCEDQCEVYLSQLRNYLEGILICFRQVDLFCKDTLQGNSRNPGSASPEVRRHQRECVHQMRHELSTFIYKVAQAKTKLENMHLKYERKKASRRKDRRETVNVPSFNSYENHRGARDSVDSSESESNASESTDTSELTEASNPSNQSDSDNNNKRKRYFVEEETDAETSELSDSHERNLTNRYTQRKKKPVNSLKRKALKRKNPEIDNKRSKRRCISVDSPSENLNSSPERNVFKGHYESPRKESAKVSSSEVIRGRGRKRTNVPVSQNHVKETVKRSRRRANSRASHTKVNDEELSVSKTSTHVEEPQSVGQKIKDDLVLIENNVLLKKFNISKKLVVKLTDYFQGCSDKGNDGNGIEASSSQEDPLTDSNVDATHSREVNSSREDCDEYQIVDEADEKENNSENESYEKDLPNDIDNESAKSGVSDSENSNDESNSDAIFNDETKDEEIDKASEKSNDDDDEMEMEEEEEEEEEGQEDDENSENKDSDSESEKSESPKKNSSYGKRGPRTPPSPFPYCGPGPRTPEGPGPGNDASDSEDFYPSVYEK